MEHKLISNVNSRIESAVLKKTKQVEVLYGLDDRLMCVIDPLKGVIPMGSVADWISVDGFSGFFKKTPIAGNNVASLYCEYHLEGTILTSGDSNTKTLVLPEKFISAAYWRVAVSHVSGSAITNLKATRSGDNSIIVSYSGNNNAVIALIISGYGVSW